MSRRVFIPSWLVMLSAVLMLPVMLPAQSTKIGIVDRGKIIEELDVAQKADKELTDLSKRIQDTAIQMRKDYEERILKYRQQEKLMTADAKTSEENAIRAMEQEILQYEQTKRAELNQRREDLLKPIRDLIATAVSAVAKEEKMSLVLDTSSQMVVFHEDALDITFKVIDRLRRGNKPK